MNYQFNPSAAHCCACSGVCNHTASATYCQQHLLQQQYLGQQAWGNIPNGLGVMPAVETNRLLTEILTALHSIQRQLAKSP